MTKITDDIRAAMVSDALRGSSTNQLSEKYNVGKTTIQRDRRVNKTRWLKEGSRFLCKIVSEEMTFIRVCQGDKDLPDWTIDEDTQRFKQVADHSKHITDAIERWLSW